MDILLAAGLLITACLIYRHNARIQAERDAAAAAQTFAHISVPILVTSNFPDDPTVFLRAEAWRDKLRASGNKYSESLPIIAYPFRLGANGEGGIATWRTYCCNCALEFERILREWDTKLEQHNPDMFRGFVQNQN